MIDLIEQNIGAIHNLCKQHHVKELYVFGSAAREKDFTNKSDLDILVNFENLPFDTNEQVFYMVENKDKLEKRLNKIFEREVDLIEEKNISNKYLKYFINKDRKLLYAIS